MMDTRSGSVDPGILLYLLEKKKMSPSALSKELYDHAGLLGISGSSSDMRDILEKREKGDLRAGLAIEVYLHRLNASICTMVAALRGLDTLVFTAGIGENAPFIREKVCQSLSFLGIDLDPNQNNASIAEDRLLSTPKSGVKVVLVHTQEDLEIARECKKVLGSSSQKG